MRHALELLVEAGDAGLTMRQLAVRADMRLSNVQYYFKSRDDVLKAMVSVYFEKCIDDVTSLTEARQHMSPRDRLRYIIGEGLKHGKQISDLCRTFRELWAISTRNPEINACLVTYYQSFGRKLVDFAVGADVPQETRAKLASLLVPYIEGYSITAHSLPLNTDAAAALLTDLATSVLEDDQTV